MFADYSSSQEDANECSLPHVVFVVCRILPPFEKSVTIAQQRGNTDYCCPLRVCSGERSGSPKLDFDAHHQSPPAFLSEDNCCLPSTDKQCSGPIVAIFSWKVNEVLSKTCAQVCVEELSLQPDHDFVVKVVQFQELLDVRHR